jgi:HTH-like domain
MLSASNDRTWSETSAHDELAGRSESAKLDRFWLEFSAPIPWLGGAESDEGIEIFGRCFRRRCAESFEPVRKRKLVDEMRSDWDVSIRRACRVFLVDTSTYHYKSRRPGQAHLEQRIKEIRQTRVRYGYRYVHVLLRREGYYHGQNKTRRIYRELVCNCETKRPSDGSRPSCETIDIRQRDRTRLGLWTSCMTNSRQVGSFVC